MAFKFSITPTATFPKDWRYNHYQINYIIYFQVQGYILLHIRWMTTESFSRKFAEKSDTWAFGVSMWEMFTLAKNLSYPHLSNDEVIHNALKREYYLFPSRSAACLEPVYEIMEQYWIIDLKQRTTFIIQCYRPLSEHFSAEYK